MNRALFLVLLLSFETGCAAFKARREPAAEPKPETKPAVRPREGREPKPPRTPAPFLVEAFRCSLQPSPNLNVGIRVYSSLDGKETSLIYGPERMDTPPLANDSFLYNGTKVILAGTADGRTEYTFQHPKISLQIMVPRVGADTAALEANYSDDSGALNIRGYCVRVPPVTY